MNRTQKKIFNISDKSLDLIAVHIPKTAGTTFCKFLLSIYGHEHVIEYYGETKLAVERLNFMSEEKVQEVLDSKPEIKAITGHFTSDKYAKSYPNTKMVIWLRDPIKRLISHYYYWQTRKPTNDLHKIVIDNKLSLLEFAQLDEIRNFMSKYVVNHSLEDFFFVGIQEYFEEDIKILSSIMRWNNPPLPPAKMTNSYPEYKQLVSQTLSDESLMVKLNQLNAQDIHLYQHALELRKIKTRDSIIAIK